MFFRSLAFAAVRNVSSVIVIIKAAKIIRYTGRMLKPSSLPSSPNSGGTNVEPIYAAAICIPITEPEFSAPKLAGVEWIMQGYMGAQPRPVTIKPVNERAEGPGMNSRIIPQARTIVPAIIIRLSPTLSEINPLKNLPAVIPI